MDTPLPNDFPRICSESGLTCEDCTAGTARHLAAVCKGLRGKAIGQLFVQIYTNPVCAPMHQRFAEHYQAASHAIAAIVPAILEEPIPARREVMFARRRAIAAVA
jgi:hypothetical protein